MMMKCSGFVCWNLFLFNNCIDCRLWCGDIKHNFYVHTFLYIYISVGFGTKISQVESLIEDVPEVLDEKILDRRLTFL